MKAMQVVSFTLLFIAPTAQFMKAGKCPMPAVQADFDISRYLGKWYDIERLPAPFQTSQCSIAIYSLKSPNVTEVRNSGLLDNGTVSTVIGSAKVKDPAEPAKLEVSFSENSPPVSYWVLSTDYDNYSLVYSCTNMGLFHMERSWFLSRSPSLPQKTVEELRSILSSVGVSVDRMVPTIQDEEYCRAINQ